MNSPQSDYDNNTNNYDSAMKINCKTLIIPSKSQQLSRISTYFIILFNAKCVIFKKDIMLILVTISRLYLLLVYRMV